MTNPIVRLIAENLKELINLKANIKQAIELKNVPIHDSTTLEEYADKIAEIEEGDIFSEHYKIYKAMLGDPDLTYKYDNYYKPILEGESNLDPLTNALNSSDITDMSYMFAGSGVRYPSFELLDLSNVTTMEGMFYNCHELETFENTGNWNVSGLANIYTPSLTKTNKMFWGCTSLIEQHMQYYDMGNVTTMEGMFYNCQSLEYLNAYSWDTGKVEDMSQMFYNCKKLKTLYISNWDTSNVFDMYNMFSGCATLTLLDLSHFNTSNVEYMSHMFYNCTSLRTLDLSNWDTSNVKQMINMFGNCKYLCTLRLDNCSKETIEAIIKVLPTNGIVAIKNIYCKEENAEGLIAPENWTFIYV